MYLCIYVFVYLCICVFNNEIFLYDIPVFKIINTISNNSLILYFYYFPYNKNIKKIIEGYVKQLN